MPHGRTTTHYKFINYSMYFDIALRQEMKAQYIGDVSDYKKYVLLRALLKGPGKLKLGVIWMLTPPDGRADGNKITYLNDPLKWRDYDPSLFELLRGVVGASEERTLALVENSAVIPNAQFFGELLPDEIIGRNSYFRSALDCLSTADIIFFDPDNGIEVQSVPKGRRLSSKYVYRDEIEDVFESGKSVLIYQHFTREQRDSFVSRICAGLSMMLPRATIWEFRTSHVTFLLLVHPRHRRTLGETAASLMCTWTANFINVAKQAGDASSDDHAFYRMDDL